MNLISNPLRMLGLCSLVFFCSGPYVSPWVTCNAIFQKAYETIVMQFLMFTYCDLHCHSILGFICLYSTLLYSPLNFVVFSFDGA